MYNNEKRGVGIVSLINRFFFPFIFTLCSTVLHASDYDDDTLEIFSKIIPRFVLMSTQKNTLQNKIGICVLHDKFDDRATATLMDKIYNNYPDGIKNYKLTLRKANLQSDRLP